MDAFESAFAAIGRLVVDFRSHEARYLSPDYSETAARQDFIDKFFTALGWDVTHEREKNPYEREVKVEREVSDSQSRRRADYAFHLAPNFRDVRFFVEAKKPARQIDNPTDYFQAIRYGWNSGTPLAVLTDFEQFRVLDCRYKPDIETAMDRAVFKLDYQQYTDREKFAQLYWLFSREAVATDSLRKFTDELPKRGGRTVQRAFLKAGVQSIDAAFLEELDGYRETLAKAFKKHNESLDGETLTEIVQRTLDRLVFLRFLEDKLIETHIHVADFGNGGSVWRNFISASRKLDSIYNGIVFKQHAVLDARTFQVDEEAFGDICDDLAHDQSPYDFNAIPIHILGSIYERFLGKVIVATVKQARVEEKPEVRKAGGVYYTPEYIVRHVVEQTVGKLIDGKTPMQISEMKFADIACGSGSFLLGVFDCLLRYHAAWYATNSSKAKKGEWIDRGDGTFRLSLTKKREILRNNIYGVDLDAQAVEVAQLSLYLKLLDEETTGSAYGYQMEIKEALLPSLDKNIVCGNSLIDTDIEQGGLFVDEGDRKLNAMSFRSAFPRIMQQGGFDAIVGNPPYIRIQIMQETSASAVAYFKEHFRAAAKGNYDIYVNFVERGLSLLDKGGMLGFILPHKFFNSKYGEPLRGLIANGKHLAGIVHFGSAQVFDGATTYTCLMFLSKSPRAAFEVVKPAALDTWRETGSSERAIFKATSVTASEWNFVIGSGVALFQRLNEDFDKLGDVADIFVGLQTSADDVFIGDAVKEAGKSLRLQSEVLGEEVEFEKALFHPLVSGQDVKGYAPLPRRQFIFFPYTIEVDRAALIPFADIERDFPKVARYLEHNRKRLEERESGRMRGPNWYGYIYLKNMARQSLPKICVPRLVDRLCATLDGDGAHFLDNVDVGGVTFKSDYASTHDLRYLLALLNSRLLQWFFPFVSAPFRGGWMSANRQFLSQVPFRKIDARKSEERSARDRIVHLADQMLNAKSKLVAAITDKDGNYYKNRCSDLARQIDAIVYELYGLSDDEIRVVESGAT